MIKLNCDLGESFGVWKMGQDDTILPFIDMANIACGFHASDPVVMRKTVELAKKLNVTIGAHTSYPDILGFGRRSMKCSSEELQAMIIYQCGALNAFCNEFNTNISYVKPHGAMYNDMMKDEHIFIDILKAISSYNKNLKLMILSTNKNLKFEEIANEYGISLLYEVFADRNYTKDGFLVPRNKTNAVIKDEKLVIQRIKSLINDQSLFDENGNKIFLKADCMCVHGDNEKALNLVKALRTILSENTKSITR